MCKQLSTNMLKPICLDHSWVSGNSYRNIRNKQDQKALTITVGPCPN